MTYLMFLSAYREKVNTGNTIEWSVYNVTPINPPRRKASHRQHLPQPAWHLRCLLPDPFEQQVVALAGMSVRAESNLADRPRRTNQCMDGLLSLPL